MRTSERGNARGWIYDYCRIRGAAILLISAVLEPVASGSPRSAAPGIT